MPVAKQKIAEMLKQRVVSGLHLGLLANGDRLPSVREVSAETKVSPRVVLAAYQRLEAEGIVVVHERSGIFVAPKRKRAELGRPDLIVDSFAEAFRHGIAPVDLPDLMRRCLSPLRRRAIVVECNHDQLFSIAGELRHDFGMEALTMDMDALRPLEDHALELRSADVLITTAFHAADVQRLSERYRIPSLVVTMCADLFGGVRQRLEQEPVYFVVSDARFARKLERIFAEAPGSANLRVLVSGRDDLAIIPPRAATYVTRMTRKHLGNLPWLERIIPEAHVFSHESGRDILSFIVESNLHDRPDTVSL